MTPDFRIIASGQNITAIIRQNLKSLTLTDKKAGEADELNIEITDPGGTFNLPRKGVVLDVALGFAETGLVSKGLFTVREIGCATAPDTITITARAVDVSSRIKQHRDASYDATTLGDVLRQIAQRNGLNPAIAEELGKIAIDHLDQTTESDSNLLSRLGKLYDAVATVKAERLIFVPAGKGKTASGTGLPTLHIAVTDGDKFTFNDPDADSDVTGVRAKWHDADGGITKTELAGTEDGTVNTLKPLHPNQDTAQKAALAKLQDIQRGKLTLDGNLAQALPDAIAGSPLALSGWRAEITAINWQIDEITHTMGDGGYTTDIKATIQDDT